MVLVTPNTTPWVLTAGPGEIEVALKVGVFADKGAEGLLNVSPLVCTMAFAVQVAGLVGTAVTDLLAGTDVVLPTRGWFVPPLLFVSLIVTVCWSARTGQSLIERYLMDSGILDRLIHFRKSASGE